MKIEINTDVANNIAKLCLNEERADMHFRVVVNKPAADGGTIETKVLLKLFSLLIIYLLPEIIVFWHY
jgi:Fe-S cluster assembly iron-binding protein IscA